MELSQLEVFLAVAREHRFSRAAEKLFRTQSAVSQTIRKLEDEMGEACSTGRRGKAYLPTPARCFTNTRERLLNLRHDAHESLTELRELQKGKLVRSRPMNSLRCICCRCWRSSGDCASHDQDHGAAGAGQPHPGRRSTAQLPNWVCCPTSREEPRLHSVVAYLDELVLVVPPKHPLATARGRSASSNWGRSRLSRILFRRPIARKLCRRFKSTRRRCIWVSNCQPCRPSSSLSPWGTGWHSCQRSAWKRK